MHGGEPRGRVTQRGGENLGLIWHFSKRTVHILRSDKTKEKGFWLLGVANWEVNAWKRVEDELFQ